MVAANKPPYVSARANPSPSSAASAAELARISKAKKGKEVVRADEPNLELVSPRFREASGLRTIRKKRMARQRRPIGSIHSLPPLLPKITFRPPLPPIRPFMEGASFRFLLQKELQKSDVGSLGRMVVPKRDAEAYLPALDGREGILLNMEDMQMMRTWIFKYRYWPNNKSRMYILEHTGDFVQAHGLRHGDIIMIFKDDRTQKHVIRANKVKRQERNHNVQLNDMIGLGHTSNKMMDYSSPFARMKRDKLPPRRRMDCVSPSIQVMNDMASSIKMMNQVGPSMNAFEHVGPLMKAMKLEDMGPLMKAMKVDQVVPSMKFNVIDLAGPSMKLKAVDLGGSSTQVMDHVGPSMKAMEGMGPPMKALEDVGPSMNAGHVDPSMEAIKVENVDPSMETMNLEGPLVNVMDHVGPPVQVMDNVGPPVEVMDHVGPPVEVMDHVGPPVEVMGHVGAPVEVMDHVDPPVQVMDHVDPPVQVMDHVGLPEQVMMDQVGPPEHVMNHVAHAMNMIGFFDPLWNDFINATIGGAAMPVRNPSEERIASNLNHLRENLLAGAMSLHDVLTYAFLFDMPFDCTCGMNVRSPWLVPTPSIEPHLSLDDFL